MAPALLLSRSMLPRASRIAALEPAPRHTSPVREAAAAFVRGTAFGWGRRELATWLVCHYSPCLAVNAAVHPDGPSKTEAGAAAASTRLDDERVEQLILDTRTGVLRLLADLPWPPLAELHTKAAIGAGHVIAIRDGRGERRWAPVGRKRMRLVERVSSLFVADVLERPADYRSVSLCRACGDLVFGRKSEHETSCEEALHVA